MAHDKYVAPAFAQKRSPAHSAMSFQLLVQVLYLHMGQASNSGVQFAFCSHCESQPFGWRETKG